MHPGNLIGNQELKKDAGKPMLHLVPCEALLAIARVLMFGLGKYRQKESWRNVEPVRYYDAAMRHLLAYNEARRTGADGIDPESNMPHIWHALTNLAFLVALEGKDEL